MYIWCSDVISKFSSTLVHVFLFHFVLLIKIDPFNLEFEWLYKDKRLNASGWWTENWERGVHDDRRVNERAQTENLERFKDCNERLENSFDHKTDTIYKIVDLKHVPLERI